MSEDTFGFNELTDAAQDNALETFICQVLRPPVQAGQSGNY